jgi:mRNA interferase HigB
LSGIDGRGFADARDFREETAAILGKMAGIRNAASGVASNRRACDVAIVADVREVYPHADQVGRCTIFNIGGNKFRLVVVIHFNRGKLFVRQVLTHEQYDDEKWKEDC